MVKRLEQVAALVVAAGLAIVSYWLFFSWAQGSGRGQGRPRLPLRAPETQPQLAPVPAAPAPGRSEATPGLQ